MLDLHEELNSQVLIFLLCQLYMKVVFCIRVIFWDDVIHTLISPQTHIQKPPTHIHITS